MLRASAFVAVLLVTTPAFAATAVGKPDAGSRATPPLTSPDLVADVFFTGIQSGDVEPAFQRAFGLLMQQKPAEAQNMIAQSNLLLKMVGRVRGWELMGERQLSPSFVERFYILSGDSPIFYRFLFYKVDGAWTIYSVAFYDQFDKLPGAATLH